MPELEIREATEGDSDFARRAYYETSESAAQQEDKFNGIWEFTKSLIITIDGEKIGWFSYDLSKTEMTIGNLHILPGNRGIPSMILNLIAMDGADHNRKVSLRSAKSDPRIAFFEREGFPIVDEAEPQIRIDVSGALNRSHMAWKTGAQLPWNRK